VIRGGGGIGYNRMEEAITLNGRSNPPFVSGFERRSAATFLYAVTGVVDYFARPELQARSADRKIP